MCLFSRCCVYSRLVREKDSGNGERESKKVMRELRGKNAWLRIMIKE